MGKALPRTHQFQPQSLGGRTPQSFRSGIVSSNTHMGGFEASQLAANESLHPARDGEAALQEDSYWHSAFTQAPYYVSGRGYDQYRPAYALGWQAAFDSNSAYFETIEADLEQRWEALETTSLLDWSEVREAVHTAWVRGRVHVEGCPVSSLAVLHASRVRDLIQLQVRTARGLALLLRTVEPPPTAFVRQVVDRHIVMLQEFVGELTLPKSRWQQFFDEPLEHLKSSMYFAWMQLKSWVSETDSSHLLLWCQTQELRMLDGYKQLLSDQNLPPDMHNKLQRQVNRLQLHCSKLKWVREHWSQRY